MPFAAQSPRVPARDMRTAPLIALIAGAAAATGFAPLDLWPLTLVGIAVLLWLVHAVSTLRRALWLGWCWGLGHFTINNNWIQHSFDFQDRMPPALGYLAVVLLALYLAVYPMLAAGVAWRLGRGKALDAAFVLTFSAAWIASEWLRATLFTGYAWDPIGVAWLPLTPVALGARFVGTYSLSGLMVLVAGAGLLLATRRWKMAAIAGGLLICLAVANHGYRAPPSPSNAPRVRVVQPNADQVVEVSEARAQWLLRRLVALSGTPAAIPRLILWPEGAVDPYLEDGYPAEWYWRGDPRQARAAIAGVLGPRDAAAVGGSALFFDARREVAAAGNSIFVVRGDASLAGRYDKAHLVPYGEYLPMRPLLGPLGLSRLVAGDVDFRPGPGPRAIEIPGFGRIGMQLCYEIIFSGEVADRANRPDMIFNPSNDAWFGHWGPPQHLAQARMRAIEEGLPILRSTPNGISAVIAADGRLLGSVPRFAAGAIEVPLPRPLPPTPFARLGNLSAAIVALLLLALAMIARRRY